MHSGKIHHIYLSAARCSAFALLLLPIHASASVLINEVAWMGSLVSANDEWIELRNVGSSAVDLSGYTLTSGNGSLHVPISGSIAGSGYFLLERTDDSTVPNVVADQIYSGSLTNVGDSLTLKNASGSVVDTVSGGENWGNIGGDNTTKDTAQRTESGWITAAGTPRRDNATSGATPTPAPSNSSGTATASKSSATSLKQNEPEDPGMTVSAGGDRMGLIGSDISFSATAYGKEKKPILNANYAWTFGDGTSKEGTHVVHQYSIPGDYAVMVNVGNIDSKTMVTDRIIVHVREASFVLTPNNDGSLTLSNQDADDIDIGGFILTGSGKQFTLPLHTIILGEGFIRFMPSILGFSGDQSSMLLYQSGAVATRVEVSETASGNQLPAGMVSGKIADLPKEEIISSKKTSGANTEGIPAPQKGSAKVSEEKIPPQAELAAGAGNSISDSGKFSSLLLWFLLLVALLGSAIAAVIIVRRQPIESLLTADAFSIVEEEDPLV